MLSKACPFTFFSNSNIIIAPYLTCVNNTMFAQYFPMFAQYFPAEYYNRWLFREDIEKIVSIMNLTNAKGRKLKWLSIYKLLQKDGVTVSKQKKNRRQCWVLYPAQGVM